MEQWRGEHPVLVGLLVWVAGFLVVGGLIVGLGLLLTHVLLPAGLGGVDASIARWFVRQRTPTLDTVTRFGSDLGSTGVIVGVALVAVLALAIGGDRYRRHRRQVWFLVAALALEITVFLTATFLVDRHRPMVPRLDATPATSSYPSGHTAAALTLYVGLAIVVWWLSRSPLLRTLTWIVAIALPVLVGLSRLYRGMHHLTDVTASVLLGCGALLVALLATGGLAAGEADRERPTVPLSETERPIGVAS